MLAYEAVVRKVLEAAKKLVPETWLDETLRDDGTTTPTNNAGVVSLLEVDGMKLLLTGDAGIPALTRVLDELEESGSASGDLCFVQVPHHGGLLAIELQPGHRSVKPDVLG
ncbi:hypothetical protein [Streptomyces sp. NPDC056165]|uniref:hypothetical protein n=1 Tax=Streptomyces sp. NPDC056165 TaxID=3345733 RepID=UPI0035DABB75